MPVSILATKLYIPPPPPKVIARPRLSDQLNDGLLGGRKLTLISAPAGFGKSTLVSEWLTQCGRPAAWLSLDENDNDLGRFLTYLIHSLQKLAPNLGGELLEILQASQASPLEAILTALLNEIVALPHAFILVLDDYHAVDSKPIDEALTFLVEHLPPQMHLVLTTREDPALPLPRLRARGQLTELRAADLRFTPAEATEFLNQVMGFHLSVKQVAALETRTEGWIAGLQLAALSMKGTQDVAGFIQTFTGDHRYIADYLIEEVLHHQPDPVRNFLLQTSILDRLNGSLCDAVTRQSGGQARLEALQRGNFFLIPLDDRRHWYRYHHLFAEVLRLHLKAEQPEQVSALHRRASVWYEENGSAGNAIHHALAAEDFERAANLIEREVPETRRLRREATLLGWLKALPEEIFHNRPVLDVHYVGTLLQLGQMEGVEAHLQNAERWLASDIHESPLFADEEEFQRLPSLVAMYHAAISLMQGRVAETIRYARQVLERARAKDNFLRGAASALVGLASWTSGDLETAYQSYAEGMANLQREGFVSDVIGGAIALAEIRLTQGRLHEAIRIYTRGLQLATEKGTPGLRGTADMYVGLSTLAYEQNDIKTAEQHLLKSEELGVFAGFPQNPYRWRVAMAHIRAAQGDLDGALILLEEAERLYISDFYPNLRPVAAFKAQVWLAHGRLGEALNWARARGLSAGDELSYLSEFEHLTFARLLLVQYEQKSDTRSLSEALHLLTCLREAAHAGGRNGSLIAILILQARACQLQEDLTGALASLEQAMRLAEPEGYIRVFLDEGDSMIELLREADVRGIMPAYTRKLLSNISPSPQTLPEALPLPAALASPQRLIEPLSQRELEILRLFKTELSGPEIADELVIALSTLRTHTKSIYSKLDVNSRRTAVKRAVELGLI